jgi:hypothetical protein
MFLDRIELSASEQRLLDRAATWPEYASSTDLTPDLVRQISDHEGIEFATALLYDRIRRSQEHGPIIERLDSIPTNQFLPRLDVTLAIAPGAFYVEYPQTGADGLLLRTEAARFGCRTDVIPTRSFGHLSDNAHIIRDWLADHSHESVILVSLSKAGAEVKLALADAPEVFASVRLWVNLSGIVQGSALAGWLLARQWRCLPVRLLFWYRGYPFSVIRELERGPGSLLDFPLRLPHTMKALHVAGFPLPGHLSSPLTRRGFRRIARLGPTDGGGIVLADLLSWPGWIYPVWGADHYLRPPGQDLRDLMRRVLHFVHSARHQAALQRTGCGGQS